MIFFSNSKSKQGDKHKAGEKQKMKIIRNSVCLFIFPHPVTSVVDELKADVDRIFTLGWLRNSLMNKATEWFRGGTDKVLPCDIFKSHRLEWSYLYHCGSHVREINDMVAQYTQDVNLRKKLEASREDDLRALSQFSYANLLKYFTSQNEESWQQFVDSFNRLTPDNSNNDASLSNFFDLVDFISIKTDILNGRSREWGLSINLYDYQPPLMPLSHEIVIESLRDCSRLFNGGNSWAAIYCILKKVDSEFEVEGNQVTGKYTNFVKYIHMIRSDSSLPALPDCKADNLRKKADTLDIEDIESWNDNVLKDLAKAFKRAIYLRRQSDGDSSKIGEDS